MFASVLVILWDSLRREKPGHIILIRDFLLLSLPANPSAHYGQHIHPPSTTCVVPVMKDASSVLASIVIDVDSSGILSWHLARYMAASSEPQTSRSGSLVMAIINEYKRL